MEPILDVQDLVKSYNGKEVLHGVSFQVRKGEIFALLGGNGAGKTTTLECVEGLKHYDKGNILFYTKEGKEASAHKYLGIQLQTTALPHNITVLEAYKLFCLAGKVNKDNSLLERFGLKDLYKKQYASLSTGQKRRLHLALALVHNPEIVFLDEPTAGLDVEGQVALHEEIKHLKESGKTVILASHDMAEVEKLCDRIAIMKAGKIGFVGRSDELMTSFTESAEICLKTDKENERKVFQYGSFIKKENGYDYFQANNISEALLELLIHCKDQEIEILDIKVIHSTLEEKFMEFLKEETV